MPYMPIVEIQKRIQASAVRRALMPLEWRMGWSVPLLNANGRLYLVAFAYAVSGGYQEPRQVGRPRLHFTIDPLTGDIVAFCDCRHADFAHSVASESVVGRLTAD